ncbi:MAG: histone deacetylase [Spirochaetes bacterium GWB1_36_13]|nr:MAG: histone deacetylase [Spirochaetes bacterium GWB1_36_13]
MQNKKKKTGLCFFPAFDWSISPTHPEREERLLYTYDQLKEEGIFDLDEIEEINPSLIQEEPILRTHICVPDVSSNITDSHKIACGGVLALADRIMEGSLKNAFALVRPPGHHAMKVVYGNRGFCNINHEAILVDYLRSRYGLKKIAVIDTDCHHGDGTQDIFWNDPNVLCISMHQDGRTLYPGTGFVHEAGGPTAYGKTLNIPLPPETGEKGFLMTVKDCILPILEDFKPDFIINSAGQDNHYTDPITNMRFSSQGYARLTELLKPDIAVLEGGYAIEGALPYTNLGILLALAGLDYSFVKEPDYTLEKVSENKERDQYIQDVLKQVGQVWKTKEKARETFKADKDGFFSRTKRIFYDTDGISDLQLEKVKDCPHCSGFNLIDSKCREKRISALAVMIPFHCCKNCREEALYLYEKASGFSYVYLQNQLDNEFLKKGGVI